MRRLIGAAVIAGAGLLAAAPVALAAPAGLEALGEAADARSLVEPAHGCHRNVQEGRAGWHYHRGPYCDRIAVPPPRRHYRGPRCYNECKYVGPIKVCKQRCDY
jgi:hypothetical protein